MTDNSYIAEYAQNGFLLSDIQMINIYHLLNQVIALGIEGAVIEAGTYKGRTTALLQTVLKQNSSPKTLHAYDSFKGLSKIVIDDNGTKAKEFDAACTESDFINTYPSPWLSTNL